jgi:hypothetical protein
MGTSHLYNEAAQRSGYPITQAEFIKHSIYWARMSSSHWMAICSFIAAGLYACLIR